MTIPKKVGYGFFALVLAIAIPSGFGFWTMLAGLHTPLGMLFFVGTVASAVLAGQLFFEFLLYLCGSPQSLFCEYTFVRKNPE